MGQADRERPGAERPIPKDMGDPNEPLNQLVHQTIECLTAIRNYTAGAREALSQGNPELAEIALGNVDIQVARAYGLLAAARTRAQN